MTTLIKNVRDGCVVRRALVGWRRTLRVLRMYRDSDYRLCREAPNVMLVVDDGADAPVTIGSRFRARDLEWEVKHTHHDGFLAWRTDGLGWDWFPLEEIEAGSS